MRSTASCWRRGWPSTCAIGPGFAEPGRPQPSELPSIRSHWLPNPTSLDDSIGSAPAKTGPRGPFCVRGSPDAPTRLAQARSAPFTPLLRPFTPPPTHTRCRSDHHALLPPPLFGEDRAAAQLLSGSLHVEEPADEIGRAH